MYKKFYLSVLLLLLLGSLQPLHSQTVYSITQDVNFTEPTDCFTEEVSSQQSNWTGGEVTVDMTHDIFGNPTSPTLYNTVNNNGWRYIYFDIFDVDALGNETLEATVTKYSPILSGGVSSGSSSTTYNIGILDLINNNVTSGQKRIKVRFRMTLSNLAHTINGYVEGNGVLQCSATPLDGNSVECNIGTTDCFNYSACGELDVYGYAELEPIYDMMGNIIAYGSRYTYFAFIIGGSGDYTYSWSTIGVPHIGTGSTFSFVDPNRGTPRSYLTVTDNVTGCVYTWRSGRFKTDDLEPAGELTLQAGPNPASTTDRITLRFNLPTDDTYNLGVYDMSGKLVLDIPTQNETTAGEHTLQLNKNLSPGIYLVRLTTGTHGAKTSKLIVQ